MKKLKNYSSWQLIQLLSSQTYHVFFEKNQFKELDAIIKFLVPVIENVLYKRSIEVDLSVIKTTLLRGDEFYFNLLKNQWIFDFEDEREIEKVLSKAVDNVLYYIQNNQNIDNEQLVIISELNNLILSKLVEVLFSKHKDYKLERDRLIYSELPRKLFFLWIDLISEKHLISEVENILEVKDNDDLSKLIYMTSKGESLLEKRVSELEKTKKKNYHKYIQEVYTLLDYNNILLAHPLSFNVHYVHKLSNEHFLKWVDKLKWTIVQDYAFFHVNEIDDYQKIIELLVNDEFTLLSDRFSLILVVLKNCLRQVFRHIENLNGILEYTIDEDSYNKKLIGDKFEKLQQDCKIEFSKYKKSLGDELDGMFAQVFQYIKPKNSLMKELILFLNHTYWQYIKVNNFVSTTLGVSFRKVLKSLNKKDKRSVIESLEPEDFKYGLLQNLLPLVFNNLRLKTIQLNIEYLLTDKYYWYSTSIYFFDKEQYKALDEVAWFSLLLHKSNWKKDELNRLFDSIRVHYCGWENKLYSKDDKELISARNSGEQFVTSAGLLLSAFYFFEEEGTIAKEVFKISFEEILIQLRESNIVSIYKFPIQLAARVKAIFWKEELSEFCEVLIEKVDSLDVFIHCMCCVFEVEDATNYINQNVITRVAQRVNTEFPYLEMKYSSRRMKRELQYMNKLKRLILDKVS